MKHLLICIVLLVSVFVGQATPNKKQTQEIFEKLAKNELGKDVFQSIQLELSVSNGQNMVDAILEMLYELRDGIQNSAAQEQAEFDERQDHCNEKLGELEAEVAELNTRVTEGENSIPALQEQADAKAQEAADKAAKIEQLDQAILKLHEQNNAEVAKYDATVQQHEDMKDALKRAKELIAQLATVGFLQKRQTVLVQLNDHSTTSLAALSTHQHSGVFKMLVKLAQDVGIQADQTLVTEILAIIDELIAYEDETADVEAEVEQMRLDRFNYDLTRSTARLQTQQALQKDLSADASSLNLRIAELRADIQLWSESAQAKQEQLELQRQTCIDSGANLEAQLRNYNETLEIIEQVIEIFENEDVQDVKEIAGHVEIPYGL